MEKRMKRYSDSKLEKELAFARSFASAPGITEGEREWLDALEAELRRRRGTTQCEVTKTNGED
jgi:hypothetical protein